MKPEIKRKWVKALLSGKYYQITGQMTNGGGGYCCLGVLAYICIRRDPAHYRLVSELADDAARELARVNDAGVPFDMIAGLIDQAL